MNKVHIEGHKMIYRKLIIKNFISNSHDVVFEKGNALDRFKIVKNIQVTLHDIHYVNPELFKILHKLIHLEDKKTDQKK